MTASEHTPGPWFVGGVRQKIDRQEALGIFWYDDAKKRDVNIASVWYDPRNGDGTLDAHLIAAAPKLLAELRNLCDAWEHEGGRHAGNITRSVADARAAIAKAEGRS
jgi:hypothetical protein